MRHTQKTLKEKFLDSIREMDAFMLDLLLDENKTYEEVSKTVFLDKMRDVFANFKGSGDTELLAYKGFCNAEDCVNKGCTGYAFVGNCSKKYVNLIINGTDERIDDIISHCTNFETEESLESIGKRLFLDIKEDEKAAFVPTIDFLIRQQQYTLAYEELFRYRDIVIDKSIYVPWLEKHMHLYKELYVLSTSFDGLDEFYWLYNHLDEINGFLQTEEQANEALKKWSSMKPKDEIELFKWLRQYEKVGCNLNEFLFMLEFSETINDGYFEFRWMKIAASDFTNISAFVYLFHDHYDEMLRKYEDIDNAS